MNVSGISVKLSFDINYEHKQTYNFFYFYYNCVAFGAIMVMLISMLLLRQMDNGRSTGRGRSRGRGTRGGRSARLLDFSLVFFV